MRWWDEIGNWSWFRVHVKLKCQSTQMIDGFRWFQRCSDQWKNRNKSFSGFGGNPCNGLAGPSWNISSQSMRTLTQGRGGKSSVATINEDIDSRKGRQVVCSLWICILEDLHTTRRCHVSLSQPSKLYKYSTRPSFFVHSRRSNPVQSSRLDVCSLFTLSCFWYCCFMMSCLCK